MHAIGVDISIFNSFIANCKINTYDNVSLEKNIKIITGRFFENPKFSKNLEFEQVLIEKLKEFNDKYFPVSEFRYKIKQKLIDENKYGREKENLFLPVYKNLLTKYKIEFLKQNPKTFIDK